MSRPCGGKARRAPSLSGAWKRFNPESSPCEESRGYAMVFETATFISASPFSERTFGVTDRVADLGFDILEFRVEDA